LGNQTCWELAPLRHSSKRAEHDNSRKAAFAARLKAAMERKGWDLSETARQTASVLGAGAKFGRAHVWQYLHARVMPRDRQLFALSHALEVRPNDLFPSAFPTQVEESGTVTSTIHAEDQGDGTAILQVSQRVPWQAALHVMRLLKLPDDGSSSVRAPSEPR
jgi:transcriptional regulator with XRE-family HTH domain